MLKPISVKREFENLVMDIRRSAAIQRSEAPDFLDKLIAKTQSSFNTQWYQHMSGDLGQVLFTVAGALKSKLTNAETFQLGSKAGDVFKGFMDAYKNSEQSEIQKLEYHRNEWSTYMNGLQTFLQNLDAALQRMNQIEDTSKR